MPKPRAYGYLAVPRRASRVAGEQWAAGLLVEADVQGLALAGIFTDHRDTRPGHLPARPDGFGALREALRRNDVRWVLVPDLGHFGHILALASADLATISRDLQATVIAVHPRVPVDQLCHRPVPGRLTVR